MNPKDTMKGVIHNFHPQYQQYTQYSNPQRSAIGASMSHDEEHLVASGSGGTNYVFKHDAHWFARSIYTGPFTRNQLDAYII
ncbi:unnamed protein product [Nippostrongylus brasiliensis]|uniref:WD_REPEATS_REGION domain-containing protein n=1 Tax=Nippostrongylus brasiliensis TaxID=27835 RepID=A0A0N4XDN1_NIPBR|nr:unnamed protein product [Nippostrongylus brasiliensis]